MKLDIDADNEAWLQKKPEKKPEKKATLAERVAARFAVSTDNVKPIDRRSH